MSNMRWSTVIVGVFDTLPWAVPYNGPAGHELSEDEAELAFGQQHWDESAIYTADGKGFARRVVLTDEAHATGLKFIFTGRACGKGHIAPRRLHLNSARGGDDCVQCRRNRKYRAKRMKNQAQAA